MEDIGLVILKKDYTEKIEVDAKAKGRDKVHKELNTKGDKAGNEKGPRYVWAKARQAEVSAENTQLMCLLPQTW